MNARHDADRIALALIDGSPEEALARYKANYGFDEQDGVTVEMLRKHWVLERTLTEMLLASSAENRAAAFDDAYTRLYRECAWLNRARTAEEDVSDLSHFPKLLAGARRIYEIGSGKGRLIRFLARQGFECVATEITAERGGKFSRGDDGVRWHGSDGIHLAENEPARHYDAAISSQVVEHMHPADLIEHLRNVRAILKPSGFYLFDTPHVLNGPADFSRVFGLSTVACMHLKEYGYGELAAALRVAGFKTIRAVYVPPRKLRRYLDFCFASRAYFYFCVGVERIAFALPHAPRKIFMKTLHVVGLWRPDIFIKANT